MKQNICCHMFGYYNNLKYNHMRTCYQNDQYFGVHLKYSYTVTGKNLQVLTFYLELIRVIPLSLLLLDLVVFSRERRQEGDATTFITIKIS